MKKERRWLKSVLVTSAETHVALPWQRNARQKPAALMASQSVVIQLPLPKPRAIAAR